MGDHATGEPESRIRRVVGGGLVFPAVLVPAIWNVRCADAAHRLHLAEQVIEDVAPVAQHVEDDAPAVLPAVVPRWALRRGLGGLRVALEHPVAEFAAHRQQLSEEALITQSLKLEKSRQPQLILHHAVLDARLFCRAIEVGRLRKRGGDRLFAVHMLAGGDGALEELRSKLGRCRIEKDFVLALKRGVEIGAPSLELILRCEAFELLRITTDEQRIGHEPAAVLERHTALAADREDRADEMLVHAHAPGDAVHDHADALLAHAVAFIVFQSGITPLAKPAHFNDWVEIMPAWIFTRTAPWLRSYRSGCASRKADCSPSGSPAMPFT